MREIDALYLIEHVDRELDVACAVKHLAETKHGLRIEILPAQVAKEYAARNLRPRLIVTPYAYRMPDPYTGYYIREVPDCKVLSLSWEQLLYKAYEEEKLPSDAFTRDYVFHHAWGDFHRERLVKMGVPEDHVFVNGQPAYMLYEEPYRKIFPTREEIAAKHGLDPGKRWLLFSENYGWAFYPPERVANLIDKGMEKATIDELVGFCDRSLRTVLPWLAFLAGKQDFEVIVRPRPATLESDFNAVLREAVPDRPSNLHVIKKESVREWILASDIVASSYSTTLIEAAVARKTAFMTLPLPFPSGLEADWYRHVPQVRDREGFVEACTRPGGPPGADAWIAWARSTLLGHGDPIAGIADLIARLADPRQEAPPRPARELFPKDFRGWQALRQPGDGLGNLPWRLRQRAKLARRRLRRRLREPARDAYVMEPRQVPEHLRKWVDARDLFDSRDVERITGSWRSLLESGSGAA